MKQLLIYLVSIIILVACTSNHNKIGLTRNQESDFTIVVSANADSLTQFAASEIQNYIYKVSGSKLAIENSIQEGKKQLIIGKDLLTDSVFLSRICSLKEDGLIINTTEDNIFLCGNTAKADMYAAYTFIEEFIGCRMFSPTEYYIPKTANIDISKVNKTYEPAFELRRHLYGYGPNTLTYMNWHKLEDLDEWGSFVHTFDDLIPPEKYFDEHPEYFSLVGNRRLMDAQLCLSNSELINTIIENLRTEIEKQPDKKYWSVSQNDCYNYCECDSCKALYEKYESISGAYVYMCNQIAGEFPDKIISTLAYQFSRSAPKNIKPLPNVNIMLCSIECNRSMPLAEDKRSASFVQDLKDWSQLTNNIFMWDYVVQFKNYLCPFPNMHVLQPNIQLFKENNARMAFQQGSGRNWSDLSELKQYLIAKLLWDPYVNVDSLRGEFIEKYYGPAAPFINSYYELTHKTIKENKEEWLNIYGFPLDYTDSYLTGELLLRYREMMDKAEAAVAGDTTYYNRVLRVRLAVDFAYLDIALNTNLDEISYTRKSGDSIIIRDDMLSYLDRFVEISKQTGVTTINERRFYTEDYRAYVLDKLERMIITNKAKGKDITVLTEYSETYPVGGAKALTDGLFGDMDFHNNWLGFQGNDMVVEIDLQEPKTISKISMNFLKAVNSWVFLPEEIKVEVSDNGKNYREVASVKGDNSDRYYLVKSIPFSLEFETEKAQYIRVTAISMKQCPSWHRGYGNPSWIFVDELIVE